MPDCKYRRATIERYEIERSPFAQNPTQRDVANLIGETRDDLRRLVNYKDEFVVRRTIVTGKKQKVRELAYPEGRLRAVHERLKYHLNKIKQPDYLFSPRRNRSQRDNAFEHLEQHQYLTLDIKQFYPSTNYYMVKRFFQEKLGMHTDVAGLLAHLSTIDGKVSFGSPLTPVLCSLVHRGMFDAIAHICARYNLRISLWVDDVTISGKSIPRNLLKEIREIISNYGLQSHKLKYRTGNRPVFITGIGVVGSNLVANNAFNLKIRGCWSDYHLALSDDERDLTCRRLLSCLGTLRYIAGPTSERGRRAADEMNSLRQKRNARRSKFQEISRSPEKSDNVQEISHPW